jgi:hypothetical protein
MTIPSPKLSVPNLTTSSDASLSKDAIKIRKAARIARSQNKTPELTLPSRPS